MKQEEQKIRVLLVEDDDEDAAIFCRHIGQLRNRDVAVVCAAGEEEAKCRLAAETFDLIFVDLELGGGESGLHLLQRLQSKRAAVPTIVVTGTGDEQRAVEAMKAGAYDYLVKDNLTADLLERTIRHAHKRHSLEQERARMVQKLAAMSITDGLTAVANRRHLSHRLREEVARSERTGHLFAVLMIDLDHFKQVNDRHGHQTGDRVLRQCAAALRQRARQTDFVARYGGEEFCVLLVETGADGVRRAAERLRKALKALPRPACTVSIGVAFWKPGSSAEDVLHRADEALYTAKEEGRDRVVVYGD